MESGSCPPATKEQIAPVQQPLAATIPPELLGEIFHQADNLNRWANEKQSERNRHGQVCRSWYFARIKRNDYVVGSSRIAAKLLQTFQDDPDRASRAQKMYICNATDYSSELFDWCDNLTEVGLTNADDADRDALWSLPASVRKLTLNLDRTMGRTWLVDLTEVPPECEVSLTLAWDDLHGAIHGRAHVLANVEPVLNQITQLTLRERYPELNFEPHQRGYLEPLLPQMTSLEYLAVQLWEVRTIALPHAVAQLGALEVLSIEDSSETFAHEVSPDLIRDILDRAQPRFRKLVIGPDMTAIFQEAEWPNGQAAELEKFAKERGIELFLGWPEATRADAWKDEVLYMDERLRQGGVLQLF